MNLGRIEEGLRCLLAPETADDSSCQASELYRYASGDATRDEAQVFETHLQACAECREALVSFRQREADRARRWLSMWTLVPAAAAATLLIAVGMWRVGGPSPGTPEAFRIKSGYRLHVAVQRGQERFMAASGDVFKNGDTLGFFYTAPADTFLTVLVADEAGSMAQAYPVGGIARLPAGAQERLPTGAIVEKGTPCEWIVGFFSETPLPADTLRVALERAITHRGPSCALPPLLVTAAVDTFILRRQGP